MFSEKLQKIRSVFTLELMLMLLWIPCVIFIFTIIDGRKIAGLVAGIGFLSLPLFNIYRELIANSQRLIRMVRLISSGIFFLFSAFPIFLLRIFNWEKSLEEIVILDFITGRQLHSLSNVLYLGMITIYLVTNIIQSNLKQKNGAF